MHIRHTHPLTSTSHRWSMPTECVVHARRAAHTFLIFCFPFLIRWRRRRQSTFNFCFSHTFHWCWMHHNLFPICDHISEQLKWWITTKQQAASRNQKHSIMCKNDETKNKIKLRVSARSRARERERESVEHNTHIHRWWWVASWHAAHTHKWSQNEYLCVSSNVFLHAIMQKQNGK